jgi:hypothetical protein
MVFLVWKKIAGGGKKAPKGENALFEVSLQFFPSTIFFQEIKKKENWTRDD